MKKSSLIARNRQYGEQVNALLSELEANAPDLLNRKPPGGGWSAVQTLHHLILTEELSLAYVKKKLGFNPEIQKAGPGARWRGFLLWASLSAPLKFRAPKTVGDDNLPDTAGIADTRERWSAIRDAWTDFFAQMPEDMAGMAVYKHPRAGRLGWRQTLAFFEVHLKRHAKQARRAVQNAATQPA